MSWRLFLTEQTNSGLSDSVLFKLSVLQILLTFFHQTYFIPQTNSKCCNDRSLAEGFILNVVNQYNSKHISFEPGVRGERSDFSLCGEDHVWLCMVAGWVGKQFNLLSAKVDTVIEDFKKTNIGNIDNLHANESMIHELFPDCMRQLLEQWLDYKSVNNTVLSTNQNCAIECTIEKPAKQCRLSSSVKSVLPLVQLILELANGALVSGVAHVVYSRVIHG